MSRDNVTPFRRPPKPKRKPDAQPFFATHRGRAVTAQGLALASGLLLVSFLWPLVMPWLPPFPQSAAQVLLLIVTFACVILCLRNRETAMPWAATHFEFGVRTAIVGMCGSLLAFALSSLPFVSVAALPIILLTALWVTVRSVVALVRAFMRLPMLRPVGWLL